MGWNPPPKETCNFKVFHYLTHALISEGESGGESGSGGSEQDTTAPEAIQPATVEVLQPLDRDHLQSHLNHPPTEVIQDVPQVIEPPEPSSEPTLTSPTPSLAVPQVPTNTPLTTPKREIKLVTANSAASDWFTRGFFGPLSKLAKGPYKQIDSPPGDAVPPEFKVESPVEGESPELGETENPLDESFAQKVEEDVTTSFVPERPETVQLDTIPEVIGKFPQKPF
jgi:hypothetical protein